MSPVSQWGSRSRWRLYALRPTMTTDPDDRLSTLAAVGDLPEGAVPISAVMVTAYLNTAGDEGWVLATAGDAALSSHVGLLTMGVHRLMHLALDDEEDYEP